MLPWIMPMAIGAASILAGCSSGPAAEAASKGARAISPTPGPGKTCSADQFDVKVTEGMGGAGHSSSVILVSNTGPSTCRLMGYPDVQLLNSQGDETAEAAETPGGFSGGLPLGAPIPSVNLQNGELASAVIEGTDMPTGNATTCPSYPSYRIILPKLGTTVKVDHEIGSCSGLSVHPFVMGFNGTFPTGEVIGLAPVCKPSAKVGSPTGPLVQIDAWSGSYLAAAVDLCSISTAARGYQLILKPGKYRIHSKQDTASVHVIVHAGQVVHLGRYGKCVQITNFRITAPGRSGMSSTTTTSRLSIPPPTSSS
jgi:hypothetical protein